MKDDIGCYNPGGCNSNLVLHFHQTVQLSRRVNYFARPDCVTVPVVNGNMNTGTITQPVEQCNIRAESTEQSEVERKGDDVYICTKFRIICS